MDHLDVFELGTFVILDGLPAVVVGLPDGRGTGAPEEHVALWFGDPRVPRASEGGPGDPTPEVWTVPSEFCTRSPRPELRH